MKCLALGSCLIVVSAGLSITINAHPETKLAELPPPPAWLHQRRSLASVFQADVFRIDTHALICAAARKHRVSAAFITSIMAAESNFVSPTRRWPIASAAASERRRPQPRAPLASPS